MESIEQHIQKDKEILADPQTNPQMRRHTKEELHDLEEYYEHHEEEIKAGAPETFEVPITFDQSNFFGSGS